MRTKVLLVDDEKEFVEVLGARLRARGMAVSTATSVKKALQKIEKECFDVVVIDLIMPEMDGIEALGILKRTKPDLPVIVFTGDVTPERVKDAMKLGAVDFVPKPTDLRILTRAIEVAKVKTDINVVRKQQTKTPKDRAR